MAKNNNKKIKETEETEVTQVTETTEEVKTNTEGTEVKNEVNDVVEEIITEATKVKTNTEGTEVVEETPEETPEMVKTSTEGTEVKTEVKDGSFILKLLSEANWYSQYVFGSHLKNKFESTVEDVKKFYDEFKNGNYLASELDYRIFRELTNYFQTTKSSI